MSKSNKTRGGVKETRQPHYLETAVRFGPPQRNKILRKAGEICDKCFKRHDYKCGARCSPALMKYLARLGIGGTVDK